jgi:UDP-glucuronate 4-epimerase
MTVLITGSAGLLGHAVRRRLEGDGRTVVPVDLRPVSDDGVEQVACDLLDPDALERLVAATGPTAIVHGGGVSGPMVSRDDPTAVVRTDVEGTSSPRHRFVDGVRAYRAWLGGAS